MKRRNLLKFAFGIAVGVTAFTAAAQAAPMSPQPIADPAGMSRAGPDILPAVTSNEEAARLKPVQVHWHGHHGGWHRRHWGWHHHRHWGWRHRHWGHHHWHHRHWRHW
ncbi:twin-arginine translocation (Tat) [Bradyrhizobium diazoefficiens]|nr:twin-arginine translocation (Tat) [Bradyrhizobium diazoefficiens]MBR0778404.1 twin-arginine translocation (Tat) [Bradyrhizobium diazoefficiens]